MLELLPEVEGEALVSVLEEDEPEVEPEAPMPEVLLLGVVVDEELALGVVLGVVLEVAPVLEPEAPIEPLEELLGVVVDDDGVLEDDEGVVLEEPVPMPEPALSPPAFGAVELELLLVPVPLLEVPAPEPLPEVWAAA